MLKESWTLHLTTCAGLSEMCHFTRRHNKLVLLQWIGGGFPRNDWINKMTLCLIQHPIIALANLSCGYSIHVPGQGWKTGETQARKLGSKACSPTHKMVCIHDKYHYYEYCSYLSSLHAYTMEEAAAILLWSWLDWSATINIFRNS